MRKKYDLIAYFLFLLVTLAFFYRFLDGREIFAFKDLSRYFYPLRQLMAEQVRAGALPLWNPYIYCGMPLLAGLQCGFFYPLTVIYYLLPFDLAFNYYIIIHYFLAACFMFHFMRHLKASYYASFLSGLVFAFSGYLLSVSNMNTSLTSVAWLPLVLLFWDKYLKEKGRAILFLILFLALMFLGGEPTIIYSTSILLVIWALVFAGAGEKLKSIGIFLLALLATAGLAAAQLFPFIELSANSNRVTVTQYGLVSMRSFPIREVIGFIMPFFYGNQVKMGSYTPLLLGKNIQDWLLSPFIGIIPFVFTALSFFDKNRKLIWFFISAGLISLLMAFGKYTPVYHVFYKILPGLSMIRYPVKFLFLATFSISALAGIGYDAALQDEKSMKRAVKCFGALFIVLGLAYLSGLFFEKQIFFFLKGRHPGLYPYFQRVLWINIQFNVKSLFYLAALTLAAAVLFYLKMKGLIRNFALGLIIIGMVFFDLLSNNSSLNLPSDPRVIHETTPNIKMLAREAGISRYFYTIDVERHNRVIYGEEYDQALVDALDQLTADRLMPFKLYDAYGYESIELQQFVEYFKTFYQKDPFKYRRLVDMINAGYLADTKPIKLSGTKLMNKTDYFYGHLYIYKNLNALPRAFLVGNYSAAKNRNDVLTAMAAADFNPKKIVVLEEQPKIKGGQPFKEAKIISYKPNDVLVEANLDKEGFLFLGDSFYSGWKAFVDGKDSKIYRANYLFRAVELNQGKHSVKFVYDPLSLKIGLFISGLTILGLAAAWRRLK